MMDDGRDVEGLPLELTVEEMPAVLGTVRT
jgi:hypothetical protein